MTTTETKTQVKGAIIQTVIALVAGLAVWYGIVNTQLAVLEERIGRIEQRQNESSTRRVQELSDLNARLGRLEARMDQIYLVLVGAVAPDKGKQ